jgi:hypothetical protein
MSNNSSRLTKVLKYFSVSDSAWVKTISNHKFDKTYFLKLSPLPVSSHAWLANQYYRLHSNLISPNKLSINAEGR